MRVHSTYAQLSTTALLGLDCVCLARGAGPILCSSASAVTWCFHTGQCADIGTHCALPNPIRMNRFKWSTERWTAAAFRIYKLGFEGARFAHRLYKAACASR